LDELIQQPGSPGFAVEPAEFLVQNWELLPSGRVLDLAMGGGRNAVFLARQGFKVEGVDISGEALAAARQLALSYDTQITTCQADLEKDYSIEVSAYSVIMVFNYWQPSLIPVIKTGLKDFGMVVYETFTIDQPRYGHPENPAFLLKYNQLLDDFRDFRVLRYREGIFHNQSAKASIIAQKCALSQAAGEKS
jgi:tellurite methyltransferase